MRVLEDQAVEAGARVDLRLGRRELRDRAHREPARGRARQRLCVNDPDQRPRHAEQRGDDAARVHTARIVTERGVAVAGRARAGEAELHLVADRSNSVDRRRRGGALGVGLRGIRA